MKIPVFDVISLVIIVGLVHVFVEISIVLRLGLELH